MDMPQRQSAGHNLVTQTSKRGGWHTKSGTGETSYHRAGSGATRDGAEERAALSGSGRAQSMHVASERAAKLAVGAAAEVAEIAAEIAVSGRRCQKLDRRADCTEGGFTRHSCPAALICAFLQDSSSSGSKHGTEQLAVQRALHVLRLLKSMLVGPGAMEMCLSALEKGLPAILQKLWPLAAANRPDCALCKVE